MSIDPTGSTALPEFRHGWRALTASTIGIGAGVATLPFYTNGLFVPELEAEFGWSRGQISLLPLIGSIIIVATAPVVGLVVDRVGVRIPATISLSALGGAYFLLAQSGSSFFAFMAVWGLMYLLAAASTAVAFTRSVNERFDRARGLALGIALGGAGVVAFAVPRLLGGMIDQDWRSAYRILGAVVICAAVSVMVLMPGKPRATSTMREAVPRSSWGTILRSSVFGRMTLAFLALALAVGGMTVHLVPMLRDAGTSATSAASTAALVGIAVIVGRVITGLLVDRLFAPHVAAVVMLVAAAGYAALLLGGTTFAPFAALGIGLALGAEVDIIGYLTARYYGIEQYGRLFGVFYAIFTVGIGLSPVLIAEIRSITGDYAVPLTVCIVLTVIASVVLATMPAFPHREGIGIANNEHVDSVRAAEL